MVGRKSPFTEPQDAHIDSYMAAFDAKVREHDPELKGEKQSYLTRWKQETAEVIKKSPLFNGQLPCEEGVTLTTWTQVGCDSDSVPKLYPQLIETLSADNS
jgi:hypothetical protein